MPQARRDAEGRGDAGQTRTAGFRDQEDGQIAEVEDAVLECRLAQAPGLRVEQRHGGPHVLPYQHGVAQPGPYLGQHFGRRAQGVRPGGPRCRSR